MGISTPCVVTLCEKSPCRSSAEGIVNVLSMVFRFFKRSYEKKKNSLVWLLLNLVPG